jgi:hypothetical protein
MSTNACSGLLHFLVNDLSVYQFVEALSGCRPIRTFVGRVYRNLPGRHATTWHSDVVENRRIGMSINLSTGVYEGGVFEIRDAATKSVLGSIVNVGFGDAILFRIAPALEHRVTVVEGTSFKTAFAGWFSSSPDYLAALRADRSQSSRVAAE